jgi:hypothetical protein
MGKSSKFPRNSHGITPSSAKKTEGALEIKQKNPRRLQKNKLRRKQKNDEDISDDSSNHSRENDLSEEEKDDSDEDSPAFTGKMMREKLKAQAAIREVSIFSICKYCALAFVLLLGTSFIFIYMYRGERILNMSYVKEGTNYYQILGLEPTATSKEIRQAYKKLAMRLFAVAYSSPCL